MPRLPLLESLQSSTGFFKPDSLTSSQVFPPGSFQAPSYIKMEQAKGSVVTVADLRAYQQSVVEKESRNKALFTPVKTQVNQATF